MSSSSSSSGSVQTVVTAFVTNGAIAGIFLILLIALRPRNREVYEKRCVTMTVPEAERPKPLASGPFSWIPDLLSRPDPELIKDLDLDGFFFLRYLRFMFIICAFGTFFLCALLLPVNATGGNGLTGFDMLALGNVQDTKRYYAHSLGTWVFFMAVIYLIYRELLFYIGCRQALLTLPAYSTRLSSRTILVNGVSKQDLNEEHFRKIYSGVQYVYICRDSKDLAKDVKERDGLANKVESVENKILFNAVKTQAKQQKKGTYEAGQPLINFIKKNKWPTMRLKKWGLPIGEKVETLEYAKQRIPELNEKITKQQAARETNEPLLAAFVTFNSQREAEMAYQTLGSYRPYHLSPRFIGIRPDEVIWSNLNLPWWRRIIQDFGATTLAMLVCIFWCIPTAFVGSISQVSVISSFAPFAWITNLPPVLLGLISSLLPTIMLAVLMMLLPPFIRWMARVAGAPSTTHVEHFTQHVYFVFQVVQVFVVTTLASSVVSTLEEFIGSSDIGQKVMNILATKVPSASNFFLAYIVLQALTVPFGSLLQIVPLLLFHALGFLFDVTPRKRWNRRNVLGQTGWGTVFPIYSCLAVIVFSYAGIAPIILPFGCLLFGFVYFAFLNNLNMCVGTTNGRGIFYSRALMQSFAGIYLAEIVLIILFVFAKAWGPVAIEAVLIFFTIYCHKHFNRAFNPLLSQLPEDMLAKSAPSRKPSVDVNGQYPNGKLHPDGISENAPTLSGGGRYNEKSSDSAGLIERGENNTADPGSGTLIQRLTQPHVYYSANVLKRHLFTHPYYQTPAREVPVEEESTAYYDGAFTAGNPVVWFPADSNEWANTQMDELRKSDINAFTTGARYVINEKNKANFQTSRNINDIPTFTADAGY